MQYACTVLTFSVARVSHLCDKLHLAKKKFEKGVQGVVLPT